MILQANTRGLFLWFIKTVAWHRSNKFGGQAIALSPEFVRYTGCLLLRSTLVNSLFLPLFLIGTFLLRFLYLLESTSGPFFDAPIVDAHTFLKQALNIANGDIASGSEPFWQPPLYIYLLALICWVFPNDYFIVIRLVQNTMGTVSCLMLYLSLIHIWRCRRRLRCRSRWSPYH